MYICDWARFIQRTPFSSDRTPMSLTIYRVVNNNNGKRDTSVNMNARGYKTRKRTGNAPRVSHETRRTLEKIPFNRDDNVRGFVFLVSEIDIQRRQIAYLTADQYRIVRVRRIIF